MSLADEQDFGRICYYGEPGTGKTSHAAAMAKLGPSLFYMAEPGLKKVAIRRRGIDPDLITPRRDVTCEAMIQDFWKLKARLNKEPNAYVGATIDTVSEMVKRELATIRRREYDEAVAKAEAAGEEYEGPKKIRTTWDHFGELADDMREVIKNFCDLPMHLAFTAHVRRDEDEDSGETKYGPLATPAVQSELVAYCDCIIRTERVGSFFIGHTTPSDDGRYRAKDRLDVLPTPAMNLPTMDRIVAYINGDLTPETDPIQQEWVSAVAGKAFIKKKEK